MVVYFTSNLQYAHILVWTILSGAGLDARSAPDKVKYISVFNQYAGGVRRGAMPG